MNTKIVSFLIILTFITGSITVTAEEDPLEYPSLILYVDGYYTPKKVPEYLAAPARSEIPADLHKEYYAAPSFDKALNLLPAGFSYVPDRAPDHIRFIEKSEEGWNILYSVAVEPEPLSLSSNYDDKAIYPDIEDSKVHDMGWPVIAGSDNYLLDNDTEHTGTWSYTTDFALTSHNIFAVENVYSSGSSNVSIVVSYGNATGGGLTTATAYNLTIFNEFVPSARDIWWRLDREIEIDGNGTDEVVLNIQVYNAAKIDERYVMSYDSSISDPRYETIYIGGRGDDDIVGLSSIEQNSLVYKYGELVSTPNDFALSGVLDSIGNILETPLSKIQDIIGSNDNYLQGWDDEQDLEQDVTDALCTDDMTPAECSEIDDPKVDGGILSWIFDSAAMDFINDVARNEEGKTNSLATILNNLKSKTFDTLFTGDSDSFLSEIFERGGATGFFERTMDFGSDVLGGLFGAAQSGINAFGLNVTGFFSDPLGTITGGLFSAISRGGEAIREGLGLNFNLIALGAFGILIGLLVIWLIIRKIFMI